LTPLVTAGVLATGVGPASAASPLSLITVASTTTTVGYQISGNLNLMGASATPTGTATFHLYSPADPSCTWPIFTSTVGVGSTWVSSSAFVTTQAGIYRWTTTYSGDSNYYGGTTSCSQDSADVNVAKARSTLKVTATAPVGGRITANASLNGYYPNGTITFFLTGPNDSYCSGAPIFSSTVAVNGVGTYTSASFDPPAAGTFIWRASYSGDSDNRAVTVTGCVGSGNSVSMYS
jgi:hypothetical protein